MASRRRGGRGSSGSRATSFGGGFSNYNHTAAANTRNGGPPTQREPVDTRLCKFFLLGGLEKCQSGTSCQYSHALQRVADLDSGGRDHSGRPGAVKAVAAWNAAEGVKIFTGSKDGQVRMWNALSWKLENAEQLAGEVHCLDIVDNFLAVGYEGEVAAYPGFNVGLARVFNLAQGRVYDLSAVGDGAAQSTTTATQATTTMAASGAGGPRPSAFAHATRVYCCAIRFASPTSLEVFTGGHEGEIHRWTLPHPDAPEFQLTGRLDAVARGGHVSGVSCLCFYQQAFLVSGGMDKTFRVWRIGSAAEPLAPAVSPLAPGAATTAVTSAQTTQTPPLECVRTATNGGGHTDVVTCVCALTLGEDHFFITGSLDSTFRAWDNTANLAFDHTTASPVTALAACADPAGLPLLLVGLQDGSIELRQPQLGFKLRATLNPNITQGHRADVRAITVGERYFCSAAADGHLMVWQWVAPLPPPTGI